MIVEQCSSHLQYDLRSRKGWTGKRTHDTTAPILNGVARVTAQTEVESKGREVGR